MALTKLQRDYEERRLSLIDTLQKGRSNLELSKQHQLYGAIKEIEHFLGSVEYYREQQLHSADFDLKREGDRPLGTRMGLAFASVGERTRNGVSLVFSSFKERVVRPTGDAFRRAKRRVQLYREVAKEVKARENGK